MFIHFALQMHSIDDTEHMDPILVSNTKLWPPWSQSILDYGFGIYIRAYYYEL